MGTVCGAYGSGVEGGVIAVSGWISVDFCGIVSGVFTFLRDASRMLSDRSAMEAARRFIAWKTGSKAAQSQWVVGSSL